jgi:hypothetical protein
MPIRRTNRQVGDRHPPPTPIGLRVAYLYKFPGAGPDGWEPQGSVPGVYTRTRLGGKNNMATDGAPRLEARDIAALGAERGGQVDGRIDVSGGFKGVAKKRDANIVKAHDGSKPEPNLADRQAPGRSS